MTFRVRITGPVDEPEFELESDPMLPRDEILHTCSSAGD